MHNNGPEGPSSKLNEIAAVLHEHNACLQKVEVEASELCGKNAINASRLDDLQETLNAISLELEIDVSTEPRSYEAEAKTSLEEESSQTVSWDELLKNANFSSESIYDFDALLPPDVVVQIEQLFNRSVERERWIKWDDYLVMAASGLAGAIFDLILNKGLFQQTIHDGIPHKRHAIDFPLAGGSKHRVIGAGHDLFRFAEARQMLIEGRFEAVFRGGRIFSTHYKYAGIMKPYVKIPEEASTNVLIMHWIADLFSKRSMPIPGWSYLTEDNDRLADFALKSYENGMNLRMLVANLSGVALTGLILRVYFLVRLYVTTGKVEFTSSPKFHEMALAAHSVNVLCNAGKVAITQNVFAINVPAIMAVIRHLIPVLLDLQRRHSGAAILKRNRLQLDGKWQELDEYYAAEAQAMSSTRLLLSGPTLKIV